MHKKFVAHVVDICAFGACVPLIEASDVGICQYWVRRIIGENPFVIAAPKDGHPTRG